MLATILCMPDDSDGKAQHIAVNPRYVVLVEEDGEGHALIVYERRTLVCFDGRARVTEALNRAERGEWL